MHDDLIFRLLYTSENCIGDGTALQREVLDNILTRAREFNQQCAVTGALIYDQRYFAQIIEGEHDSVQTVFERIQCDTRHRNITVLSIERSKQRAFGDWSMRFLGDSISAMTAFNTLTDQSATPRDLPRKNLLAILQQQLAA